MIFKLFGGGYRKARKSHVCWCCGKTIEPGEGYFSTCGNMNGSMFSVKHCRKTCECTAELLDQNPDLRPAVFYPTLSVWKAIQ